MTESEELQKLQEQVALLKMVHNKVSVVGKFIFCEGIDDDSRYRIVLDCDGREILKGNNEIEINGNFGLCPCDNKNDSTLVNFNTGMSVKISKDYRVRFESNRMFKESSSVTYKICVIEKRLKNYDSNSINNVSLVIFDDMLNVVCELKSCSWSTTYKLTSSKYAISCTFIHRSEYLHITPVIDIENRRLVYYDKKKIEFNDVILHKDKSFNIVAYEYDSGWFSYNRDTCCAFKYKIYNENSGKVSEKSYSDIVKTFELSGTDLLYTYDVSNNGLKMGLIKEDGTELVTATMESIVALGKNNYLLTARDINGNLIQAVFNEYNGLIFKFEDNIAVTKHETLPLSLIHHKNDNTWSILDCSGEHYGIDDFKRKYCCYKNKNNKDILKVKLEYGTKYITTQFVPVTNLATIQKLNSYGWDAVEVD